MEIKTNSLKSISILFVEDDDVSLGLQSSLLALKFPNAVLYTAVNGRLGLDLFKAHTPDIVITDINMSEMSGVQMAVNIRALATGTKIISITGNSGETGINGEPIIRNSDGKMINFDHVIVKPVDLSELCDVIGQYINEIAQRVS